MKIHHLKLAPLYFQPSVERKKMFEIRKNDRGFEVGDLIVLSEWTEVGFTGRHLLRAIAYILESDVYLPKGYVALSLKAMDGHKYVGDL